MRIIVIGGTGMIGSKVVADLTERGHEAVAASPNTGVNTITGEGLAEAFEGADVVLDVTNSPSWEPQAVMDFFVSSTTNQLAAEKEAGVGHHVALSIVGADREQDSAYMRAKVAQEKVITDSGQPYTIVRSTQFHEFVRAIVEQGVDGDVIRLTDSLFQPIAADDVAAFVTDATLEPAANGIVEIGGPDSIPLADLGRRALDHEGDSRAIVADANALYYGARVAEDSLTTGPDARIGKVSYDAWLADS
ncbi:SDR family oxidoreductase [Nocardioides sp. NPDC101246]|uniref:SDR family oxidoreductase n=1 Tax=Nocardioides sp. NPDC101246 TaxID=3364336 RepID=UPI00382E736B